MPWLASVAWSVLPPPLAPLSGALPCWRVACCHALRILSRIPDVQVVQYTTRSLSYHDARNRRPARSLPTLCSARGRRLSRGSFCMPPLVAAPSSRLAALGVVAAACALVAAIIRRRKNESHPANSEVLVAACDLDKTVYPPAGPGQAEQLAANIAAMAAFERVGGFVFPVTGNNPPQAQVKFRAPSGATLRDVSKHPGIFCNGGLILGPNGVELERQTLGTLNMCGAQWEASASEAPMDFVTALLTFWDAPAQRDLTAGVGLLFFLPDALLGYEAAYEHVEGFCRSQRVQPTRGSRATILAQKDSVLQLVLLFPPLAAGASSEAAQAEYEASRRPWQEQLQQAMEAAGLTSCRVTTPSGRPPPASSATRPSPPPAPAADGVKFTLMKDPWPEMDITVGGWVSPDLSTDLSTLYPTRECHRPCTVPRHPAPRPLARPPCPVGR